MTAFQPLMYIYEVTSQYLRTLDRSPFTEQQPEGASVAKDFLPDVEG